MPETETFPSIPYIIRKKKVKNYAIRITPEGQVIVTIPVRGSEKQAMEFVKKKKAWICKKLFEMERKEILHTDELKWKWEDEDRLLWVTDQVYRRFADYGIPYPKMAFRKMRGCWGLCEKSKKKVTLYKML